MDNRQAGSSPVPPSHPFFFIVDSLPDVWCIYEDGINFLGCETSPSSSDFGWTSLFSLGEGWHRFTVVVFDSAAVFKDWLRFRVDGDPECIVPTTDRTILLRTPLAGANVTLFESGIPVGTRQDLSLRLKNGSGQDDAIEAESLYIPLSRPSLTRFEPSY